MTIITLKKAIVEAEQFLLVGRELLSKEKDQPCPFLTGSKESGACRRASMDLTRALADLRKWKFQTWE